MRIIKYNVELADESRHNVLVKESARNYNAAALDMPYIIVNMLNDIYRLNRQAEERVYMIALDNKNKPLGVFEISHGSGNFSVCNPREIYIRALLCGAFSVILAHNHPSGDPTPSRLDIEMYADIKEAGRILGVKLLDSIVIGNDQYFSFEEQ